MLDLNLRNMLRLDCLASLSYQPNLAAQLASQRIVIVGGTGFAGSWIAEMVAAINDEFGSGIRLSLLGRSALTWATSYPHLAEREDIQVQAVDVRSSFELPHDTTLVLFAAGVADPRVHASDPLRVYETALSGIKHSLEAATRLEFLQRFVNLSSGLVLGEQMQSTALSEGNITTLDFTRVHHVYAESRRSAENLLSLYASQFRIPTSTARAFTFLGPYQSLDAPWAANNFIRDALTGNNIRIHGDGAIRRSYLYGSDAASWLLRILVDGQDGEVYNTGGQTPVSHEEMANITASLTVPNPLLSYKSQSAKVGRCHDFFPDVSKSKLMFGLTQAFDTEYAVRRTMQWHARRNGLMRRLRENDSAP